MKRPKEHVKEDISRKILEKKLPDNWILRDINPDYGIDKSLEIVEGENVTGKEILIQLKGTETPDHHGEYLSFSLDTKNLKYYLERDTPVVLIVVDLNTDSCYWIFTQKYAFEVLNIEKPDWRDQGSVTLRIPLNQKVNEQLDKIIEIAYGGTAYLFANKINQIPSRHLAYWETNVEAIVAKSKVSKNFLQKSFQLNLETSYHWDKEGDGEKSNTVLHETYESALGAKDYETAVRAGLMIAYKINALVQNEELWNWLNEIREIVEEVNNNSFNILWHGSIVETVYCKLIQRYNSLQRMTLVSSQTPSSIMTPFLVEGMLEIVNQLYDLETDFVQYLNKAYEDGEFFLYVDFINRLAKMHWIWVYYNSLKGNSDSVFKQLDDVEKMLLFANELSDIISEDSKFNILLDFAYLYNSMERYDERDSRIDEAQSLAETLEHKGYMQGVAHTKMACEKMPTIPFLLAIDDNKGSATKPTFEQEEEMIISLLKDGGIDVEKGTDRLDEIARIGLKDRNPERILKHCEYLYTEIVTYGPIWDPVGLPETGLKILYCEKKGSLMNPSLDNLLDSFKRMYCENCEHHKPRSDDWKWTRKWQREREIPKGMKKTIENFGR